MFISFSLMFMFLLSSLFTYVYFNLSIHLSSHEQFEFLIEIIGTFFLFALLLYLLAKKFLFPILELNTMVLAQRTPARNRETKEFFNDEIAFISYYLKALKKEVDVDASAIEKLSLIDNTTGINNRYYFFEFGERLFKLSKRNKETLSLIIFELDSYDETVIKYGTSSANFSLNHIAKETQKHLRKSDIFARFAENEFVILLPNTTEKQAQIVSKKILNAFESPEFKNLLQSHISLSISLSSLKNEDIFLRDIVHRCTLSLNSDKKNSEHSIQLC